MRRWDDKEVCPHVLAALQSELSMKQEGYYDTFARQHPRQSAPGRHSIPKKTADNPSIKVAVVGTRKFT
jgi:hypothetical protein